jgi:hypothetical protein
MPGLKDNTPLTLQFKNFMKGYISRLPPERIPPEAFLGQNIDLGQNFVPSQALGQVRYNATGLPAAPQRGGCTYITTNGTKYYVVACGGSLYYSIAGSGTFTQYQVKLTGGGYAALSMADNQAEFAQFEGNLYVVNGNFPVISNADALYADSRIIVITGTEVHIINGTEGANSNAVPAGLQYIWVDKQRLFAATTPTSVCGLFWTNAYFLYNIVAGTVPITGLSSSTPWTPVSGLNYDTVGEDDGEHIAGIFPYQNNLIVFKPRNVYTYSTVGDITNWGSVRADTRYGCPFNRTIQEMEGYLYWLSYDGIVQFDGTNANLIDDNIRNRILGIPQLASSSRQWFNGSTPDFAAGTFGADLIDDSDNELMQKSQAPNFANGTFGIHAISGTGDPSPNLRLLSESLQADWNAGAFSNAIANGNAVILTQQTISTPAYIQQLTNATTYGTLIYFNSEQVYPDQFNYCFISARYDLGSALAIDSISSDMANCSYSDDNITYHTGDSGTHRYWALSGFTDGSSNTVFNYHYYQTVQSGYNYAYPYYHSGTWTSAVIDLALTPISMGILAATYSGPSGTGLTFYTRTSADNITWGGWIAVAPGAAITSTANRYVQIQVALAGTDSATPVLNSVTISAPFQSKILDYGMVPATYGTFQPQFATPSSSSISWYMRSSASADMSSPTAWIVVTPGSAIPAGVTLQRYVQWQAIISPSTDGTQTPQINDVFFAGEWYSAVEDLGATPTGWQWGNFLSTYQLNANTITFWMRSGTTSGNCTSASWVQQTNGTPVTGVTLNRYIQVKILFDQPNAQIQPICYGFNVAYYTGANIEKPCAYVYNKEYCLNVADVGQTINNLVWRYSSALSYFLPRTNKYNNVYWMDEGILLSGASTLEGAVRINEIGNSDDGVAIDAWFTTKNTQLDEATTMILRRFVATYSSDQPWIFSFSVDGGQTWTAITMPASSASTVVRKTLPGLNLADFIILKCEQTVIDATWQIQIIGIEYDEGYPRRND